MEDVGVTLSAVPASVGVARQAVTDLARAGGFGPFPAALLTSELVANAVEHARTPVRLHIRLLADQVLRVEVHDDAGASDELEALIADPPARVDPLALRGRGLLLVRRLADRFGLSPRADGGKAVWFELDPGGQRVDDAR